MNTYNTLVLDSKKRISGSTSSFLISTPADFFLSNYSIARLSYFYLEPPVIATPPPPYFMVNINTFPHSTFLPPSSYFTFVIPSSSSSSTDPVQYNVQTADMRIGLEKLAWASSQSATMTINLYQSDGGNNWLDSDWFLIITLY